MKNIILLITDTFRYDNLGERAARPVRTPELDRFAAERATEITGFYTASFPTIPHRTDVATGVLGWPHYGWQPIEVSGPNHIAKMLNQAGYATQLICDCPHLFNSRFQFGFEAAFQHRGQEGDVPLLHGNDPMAQIMDYGKTRMRPLFRGQPLVDKHRWANRYWTCEQDSFPAKTGATTVRWLEENYQAGPFFLWVDFFDPHEPWDAPEYLVRRYDPDYDGPPMMHPNYGRSGDYTEAELQNLWAHYAAEAELVDRWLGRVLQKLDDLQLWDDSIVVVTSDHGMSLGEHERTGKSNINERDPRHWPIYPEIGHVPFLAAGGAVPRGQTRDIFGQAPDILPTLCELAGASVEPPKPFDGQSLAASILSDQPAPRDYAISGCFVQSRGDTAPRKACTPFVHTKRWGYAPVGACGAPELYDLTTDPLAAQDVAADHPDAVKEMHALLLDHLAQHGAGEAFLKLWQTQPGATCAEGKWAVDYA